MTGALRKNIIKSDSCHSLFVYSRGVTLVELMVALLIFSIMSVMIFAAMRADRKVQARTRKRMALYARVRATMERLSRDLQMAYLSLGENLMQQQRRTFFMAEPEGAVYHLSFTYFGHIPTRKGAKEADTAVVEYYVTDTDDGPTLMRRETHRLASEPPEQIPGEEIPMAKGIDTFTLEFFDPTKDEWEERWNTVAADGQPNRLPALVRIHIAVKSPTGGVVDFYTSVKPRVTDAINLMPSAMPGSTGKPTGRRRHRPPPKLPGGVSGGNSPIPVRK